MLTLHAPLLLMIPEARVACIRDQEKIQPFEPGSHSLGPLIVSLNLELFAQKEQRILLPLPCSPLDQNLKLIGPGGKKLLERGRDLKWRCSSTACQETRIPRKMPGVCREVMTGGPHMSQNYTSTHCIWTTITSHLDADAGVFTPIDGQTFLAASSWRCDIAYDWQHLAIDLKVVLVSTLLLLRIETNRKRGYVSSSNKMCRS